MLKDLSPEVERIFHNTPLEMGGHRVGEDGRCAMEMVALLAGEPHSYRPKCVCPVIATFVRHVNDWMTDDERQLLKPFLPAMIGTNDEQRHERLSYLCMRVYTSRRMAIRPPARIIEHVSVSYLRLANGAQNKEERARVIADVLATIDGLIQFGSEDRARASVAVSTRKKVEA